MDEYLFTVMAQLKADRLRLQREAHAEAPSRGEWRDEPEYSGGRHQQRARRVGPKFQEFAGWGEES